MTNFIGFFTFIFTIPVISKVCFLVLIKIDLTHMDLYWHLKPTFTTVIQSNYN